MTAEAGPWRRLAVVLPLLAACLVAATSTGLLLLPRTGYAAAAVAVPGVALTYLAMRLAVSRLVAAPARLLANGERPPAVPAELAPLLAAQEALRAEIAASARAAETARAADLSRLRHDLRGALAPALLIADRLLMSEDSDRRRAGDIIAKCVARATDRLRRPDGTPDDA